jgi:hypothetical protein
MKIKTKNIILFFLLIPLVSWGQQMVTIDGYTILPARVVDGDTIPNVVIQSVTVFSPRRYKSKRDYRQHQRLIRNLKAAYPYAQIAKNTMSEMENHFQTLNTKKERDAYIKEVEKKMRADFESQLVKLTVSQGRILIKLIDRELGRSSYDLVKDLKGGTSAVFWQTVARIFGSNLKVKFDSEGEDKMLNELIVQLEMGMI